MRDVTREVSIEHSLNQSAQRLDAFIPDGEPTPSQHAMANEQRLALAEVLESLPADYRQVILLRNLEELSHEEVARRKNRSEGAVRMLWVRALGALRDALQESKLPKLPPNSPN
jgi:RNA polymerase sigma-70 factor (ECF subfamily)